MDLRKNTAELKKINKTNQLTAGNARQLTLLWK